MRPRWFVYLVIAAPLCWFFGRVVLQQEVLDFRDICHYYRPLWQWTSSEWGAGRIPLWCDLEGLGLPIHADPTASIFYPGQLAFALPLPFTTRLNLYVVAHVLLAAVLMYRTARGFGATRNGAAAAAISYAYGGHVLFQYCNPIFLVGAAWLPLAALATERTCLLRSWRWAVVLAVSLALMILGGDLQLAYHVGMLAALYGWLARTSERSLARSTVLLSGGLILAGLLSAVQVLPSTQWSARSERAATDHPRSLWELHRPGDPVAGIFGEPAPHSHHEHVYDFSVGPWRWLEFVWPNIGGRMFPEHHRWMAALPAEGRVWSPSLYLGLITLLAAAAAFSLKRAADARTRWLSWMTLFGIAGSLGIYGLSWLWQEVTHDLFGADPQQPPLFGAVGGLYWLMTVVLPGYVQFRYPAKWMVFASLGLSLLAAQGWDKLFEQPPRWLRSCAIGLVGLSIVLGVGVRFTGKWLQGAPDEFPFGPLIVAGAMKDVSWGALQCGILSAVALVLVARRRAWPWSPTIAVLLTAIDLCVAHGWMISTTPQATFDQPIAISEDAPAMPIQRVYRATPHMSIDDEKLPPSAQRLTELSIWERATLAEKIGLGERRNVANMTTTLEPTDLAQVWQQIDRVDAPVAALRMLGIDGRLDPAPRLLQPQETRESRIADYQPAYFTDDIRIIPPMDGKRRDSATDRDFSIASNSGDRRIAVVETHDSLDVAQLKAEDPQRGHLVVERLTPALVAISTNTRQPRLLVLADYHAPGWTCELLNRETGTLSSTRIYRTNQVLRGVVVPAGQQLVLFRYRPWLLYLGALISGIAWSGVLIVLIRRTTKHTKGTKEKAE